MKRRTDKPEQVIVVEPGEHIVPAPREGAPTKYTSVNLSSARKMSELGATDEEIAEGLGVDVATIYRWRHNYPEFCEATKVGKQYADDRVKRSLYQSAISGDTTAAIFWSKNRMRDEFQDGFTVEHKLPTMGEVEEAKAKIEEDL